MSLKKTKIDPSSLLNAVNEMPSKIDLSPYLDAIIAMREEKGMNFKRITDYLNEAGISCVYSDVYNLYRKQTSDKVETN